MTKTQERVAALLYEHRYGPPLSCAQIADAIYGDDPDGGPVTAEWCVKDTVRRLRPVLAELGCAIATEWGRGYRLVRLS